MGGLNVQEPEVVQPDHGGLERRRLRPGRDFDRSCLPRLPRGRQRYAPIWCRFGGFLYENPRHDPYGHCAAINGHDDSQISNPERRLRRRYTPRETGQVQEVALVVPLFNADYGAAVCGSNIPGLCCG